MRSIHLVNAEMLAKPVPYEGSGGKSTSLPLHLLEAVCTPWLVAPASHLQRASLQPLLLPSCPLHSLSPTLPRPCDEDPGTALVPRPHSRVISPSQEPWFNPICRVAFALKGDLVTRLGVRMWTSLEGHHSV